MATNELKTIRTSILARKVGSRHGWVALGWVALGWVALGWVALALYAITLVTSVLSVGLDRFAAR